MILAFHSIISFHGFWLPNDPRGSGSDYIANWELFRFGPATKVTSRQSVAYKPHDHARRLETKKALKHPPVQIAGIQALTIATGFAKAIQESGYRIHACAILPDHVHLVIAWHPQRWSFVTPFDLQVAMADRRTLQATRPNENPRRIGGAAQQVHRH